MEHPFFRNASNFYSPNYPRHHTHQPLYQSPQTYPQQYTKLNSSKPKSTVSIPVHFVSTQARQSSSASKVQAQFRGYLTRKSANKLIQIKHNIDDIALSLSKKETMEKIRKDSKERLKVNEMLMALLLKLDTVSGVVVAVRECRKRLIKRVISLQECVDDIVNGDGNKSRDISVVESDLKEPENSVFVDDNVNGDKGEGEEHNVQCLKKSVGEAGPNEYENEVVVDMVVDKHDQEVEIEVQQQFGSRMDKSLMTENAALSEPDYVVVSGQDSLECDSELGSSEKLNVADGNCIEKDIQDIPVVTEEVVKVGDNSKDMKARAKGEELLEKVVKENEKLVNMMSKLCEKNEFQTKLLSELTRRVEDLEKSLKRRKKKQRLPRIIVE